ncbi:MAG: hypothetical protein KGL15_07595 [Acidobacteriota bacterium]|nr:hypothetical protein [Acidobacteriota bacterium]
MIVLNIALMLTVVVAIVALLAWAIVSDRKSYRTAGGEISPAEAPLHRNLTMPHELRRAHHTAGERRASTRGRRVASASPA